MNIPIQPLKVLKWVVKSPIPTKMGSQNGFDPDPGNLVVLPSERIVHIVALVLWLVILAVHVGWFLQWPPRAMFEGTPWCWARQADD